MDFFNQPVFQQLAQYAYQPELVYLFVFGIMLASGFGLPIPEEVTIVSVGFLAYMGAHPEYFPPPNVDSRVVGGVEAAIVTSIAVFSADMLVFSLGRFFGAKIMQKPTFQKWFGAAEIKAQQFFKKYGDFAAFLFRFTPGARFPGHLFLGASKFSILRFAIIDGFAVLISVPTQILLVFHFGEPIFKYLYKFKIVAGIAIAVILVALIYNKIKSLRSAKRSKGISNQVS